MTSLITPYFLIKLCLPLKLLLTCPSVPSPARCLSYCSIWSSSPPDSVGFLIKCTPFCRLFFYFTSTSTFLVKWKSIRPSCWNSKRFWVFLFSLCTPPSVNYDFYILLGPNPWDLRFDFSGYTCKLLLPCKFLPRLICSGRCSSIISCYIFGVERD